MTMPGPDPVGSFNSVYKAITPRCAHVTKPAETPSTATFGELLRMFRLNAGVSLGELARRINYSKSQVSKIENGLKPPTVMFARQCDLVLGTDRALVDMVPARPRRLGAVRDLPVTAVVGDPSLDVGVRRDALAVAGTRARSDRVGFLVGHGVAVFGEFSAASEAAARASTTREFGAACGRLLAEKGLSQGEVARRAGHRLPKSTVNRMVTGTSLCQTPDQVLALLETCHASHEAEVWLQSWERARVNKRRKPFTDGSPSPTETSASTEHEEHATPRDGTPASPTATSAADRSSLEETAVALSPTTTALRAHSGDTNSVRAAAGPVTEYFPKPGEDLADEDILLDLRVRVTRQHVRKALPVLAAMGLLGAGDDETISQLTPGALIAAAGMALIDDSQRIIASQHAHTDADDQNGALRATG